jgi:hypothetical protein
MDGSTENYFEVGQIIRTAVGDTNTPIWQVRPAVAVSGAKDKMAQDLKVHEMKKFSESSHIRFRDVRKEKYTNVVTEVSHELKSESIAW